MTHRERALALVIAAVLATALATCKGSNGDTSPEVTNPAVSALIGPSGATLRLPDGAQVTVPAGALAAPVLVTLTHIAPPASGTSVGAAVRIDPAIALLVPARVTLPLVPALVPPGAGTSSLVVALSPDGVARFVPLASTADLTDDTVTASTVSFGAFAAMQPSTSIFITTPSPLPPGTVSATYATSFAAVGGSPPYTWTVPAGDAPSPGVMLGSAGSLAGTPMSAGRTFFFVRVTDSHAQATEAVFECDINPEVNPAPVLAAISPASVPLGSPAQSIALTGSGFVMGTVAQLDSAALATTYSSATQLVAIIPASSLGSAGTHTVTAFTGAPGGGTSAGQTFTVTLANPVPSLTALSPTSVPQGATNTQITLTGTNFVATSVAQIGTQTLSTFFVSDTQLLAVVPTALLATAGALSISVTSPPPGGGTSGTVSLQVIAAMDAGMPDAAADSGGVDGGCANCTTYAVGTFPYGIAFDGTYIWTANSQSNDVTKLLASTGTIVGTYPVGTAPRGIVYDGTNMWIANQASGAVTKLLASNGVNEGTFGVSGIGITFDGANIWVGQYSLTKLLASTGAVVGTYATGGEGMAFDGTYIWATNSANTPGPGTVTKLLASTGAIVGTYPVGVEPMSIAFDGTNIWVTNFYNSPGTVTKLDASTGALVGTYGVGGNPSGITFDGTNIWIANYGSNTVTKLLASTGILLDTYAVGNSPEGILFDGTNIWVTNYASNTVTKIAN
jgi:hypothetical protein